MRAYFDTGLLVKLYLTEDNSPEVTKLIQSYGLPICFCGLQQAELKNALYRKYGRGEISKRESAVMLKRVQRDLDESVLVAPEVDWVAIWSGANRLTVDYASRTQCRTLDILHLSVALQLGIKIFGTTDVRQTAVARKVGLKVVHPA